MRLIGIVGIAVALVVSAGARAETITVSATRSLASSAIFLADDQGFFREEGLTLEFKYFNAAQPVAVAVASGDAQFGITGLSAGFYNMAGKQALKIIAAGAREEPDHSSGVYVVSNEEYQNGLRSPQDLAGKTFGLTTVGSPFHYALLLLGEKYKFDVSKMRLVPLQTFSNILAALKGHQVEAGILNTYIALPAEKRGDIKIIGWVGNETPWALGAVFTSSDRIKNQRNLVDRFVRAYRKGAALYHDAFFGSGPVDHEKQQRYITVLSKYSQLTSDQVKESLNYMDANPALDIADISRQIQTWKRLNKIGSEVRVESIVAPDFVSARQ